MKLEQCHAIVLSALNYGESDRVVSLFTLEHGRLRGFAKAARASRKRFSGLLEPTNRLELLLELKDEGLCRLERLEQAVCHHELREQLESLALALYACELVDCLTPEGHPLPRLFRLLTALLEHLSIQRATPVDRRFFEINLLNILGYRPLLDTAGLQPLQLCLKTGSFGNVRFNASELDTAARLLDREISSHLGRSLKSLTFLESVM